MDTQDREALALIRQGHDNLRQAMTIWDTRYRSTIIAVCASIVLEQTLAEDIAQEVLLAAVMREGHNYKEEGHSSVLVWLLTIARHKCRDAIRHTKRERRREEIYDQQRSQPVSSEDHITLIALRASYAKLPS